MPGGGNLVRSPRYRKKPRVPRSAHARYYYTRSLVLEPSNDKSHRNISRCQSAPREMDSHSRSASPRDMSAPRPQHRPPSPPPATPPAFDNRAYQPDEDHNHNDSFSSQHQNGHTKEQNGTQTKTPEAVNLELINLTPKNGSKKKDVEVDMNASNPYDEYFVPVNEHRKYMRGEKLYVTADKRGEKGGCKRPLCWTMLVLVAAVVIALIVLAATGILFTNSPTPLEQYNSSSAITSARAFGGLGSHDHSAHDHDHSDHDHDHSAHDHEHSTHDHDPIDQDLSSNEQNHSEQDHIDHEYTEAAPTAEPSPKENTDTERTTSKILNVPVFDESTEAAMFVPRTVEGELKIDNEEITPQLMDPESEEFREFNENFGNSLKKALFDEDQLGNHHINIEVISVRPGSLIVTYRIHWKPKMSSEVTEDILTANSLNLALDSYLNKNRRMISVYHVAEDKMFTRQVLDLCHLNKNGCEYGCSFDETTLDFICTCPRGQILDIDNSKKCMSILESSVVPQTVKPIEDTKQKEFRVLDISQEVTTSKQIPEDEKSQDNFDWKSSQEVMAETTVSSTAEFNYPHIFSNPTEEDTKPEPTTKSKPELEPSAQPEPEPSAQPEPESSDQPEPEPSAQPEPEPTAQPEPEPTAQPEPEPTAQPEPEPAAQPEPEPATQPEPEPAAQPEPEPAAQSEPEPAAHPELEPTAQPDPESVAEPGREGTIKYKSFGNHEPFSEPESTSEPEPEPEPEPASYNNTELIEKKHELSPVSEREHSAETQPQLTSEPELTAEPQPTSDPEPTSEPKSELSFNTKQFDINTFISSSETEANTKSEPLWKYEHVPETQSSTETESISESERTAASATDPTELKMSQEAFPLDHSHNKQFEHQDVTKAGRSTTENTMTEPEEVRPDVFSIYESLNNNQKTSSNFGSGNEQRKDLQHNNHNLITDTENKEIKSITESYMDILKGMSIETREQENETKTETQKEILKPIHSLFAETTTAQSDTVTTPKVTESDDDISFDLITKENENVSPISVDEHTELKKNQSTIFNPLDSDEIEQTTATESIEHVGPEEVRHTYNITRSNVTSNTNTSTNDSINIAITTENTSETLAFESSTNSNANETRIPSDVDKTLQAVIDEAIALDTTTITKPTEDNTTEVLKLSTSTEYSLARDYKPEVQDIMEFLDNRTKTTETTTTTTTKKGTTEVADISFDVLNSFFNRSSKSFQSTQNGTIETTTESRATTTPSDWLTETVSEINYKDMILEPKDDKKTTTDPPLVKIEEMMNKGLENNDFEPEYLNLNPTKSPEQDVAFYGMVHDYDSEDARVKRVNLISVAKDTNKKVAPNSLATDNSTNNILITNNKTETPMPGNYSEIPTEPPTTEMSDVKAKVTVISLQKPNDIVEGSQTSQLAPEDNSKNGLSKVNDGSNDQIQSTTVSQYIFKSAEKVRDEPAPVWEKEEEQVPVIDTTTTSYITLSELTSNKPSKDSEETTTIISTEEGVRNESLTPVNNLNVTIYEIPGQNQSLLASKSIIHSSEYEDHETEMNPFLPEVENNKSLVKKLLEGHDLIEPANVNETQNENPEEHHSTHSSVSTETPTTTPAVKSLERSTSNNEEESTVNELNNDNYNSPEVDTSVSEINNKAEKPQEKPAPVSTFLQDTDDLDVKKDQMTESVESTTSHLQESAIPSVVKASDEESDYLSVVPIVEERREEKETLRKNFINGGIQKLNDISDSPKKSDRRTLDVSKADSVTNNEA